MRFKFLFKSVFAIAFAAAFLDYVITNVAFSRGLPIYWELNPYVRWLFTHAHMNPHLAVSLVFFATVLFVLGTYLLLRDLLYKPPYSLDLREVGSYLWNLDEIRAKDVGIFVCLALALVFAVQHIAGFAGWLRPLCMGI